MLRLSHARPTTIGTVALLAVIGTLTCCAGAETGTSDTYTSKYTGDTTALALDLSAFSADAIVGDVETVDCTLSNGVESTCYSFTLAGTPEEHDIRPFCPENIADDPSNSGIWLEGGAVYDVSGSFIAGLRGGGGFDRRARGDGGLRDGRRRHVRHARRRGIRAG